MANRMNRYKALAADLARHDTASVTPRHVFVRARTLMVAEPIEKVTGKN